MRGVVLAAMPEEAAPYAQCDLGGDVTVAVTGIGAVNAAVTATRLIAKHRPDVVISTGSAGGLADGVAIGDVVVGTEYRYHGADATAFGYQLGQIPGMPPAFLGAATWLARAQLVAAAAEAEATEGSARVHLGGMLSGDSFIAAHLVGDVRTAFPAALATDMESTALAQTCHLAQVPFLSVRAISDRCDGSASDSFHLTLDEVAARAATVVEQLLTHR